MFENTLDWLLKGNFFNFIILLVLFAILFVKFKFGKALDTAKENVVNTLKKSDEDKQNSEKTLSSAKKDVENLPNEIAKINNEAQKTVEAYKKTTDFEIEETEKHLENNAQKIIETETQKISLALQREVATKSIDNAKEKTIQALKKDNNLHRKFIEESINKIEEINI